MKKRVFAALMAGVMGTMMFGTTFVSAEAETPELKGEVYAFIAASLNNAMEEIQKNSFYMPDKEAAEKAGEYTGQCMEEKDSVGGVVECIVDGMPTGVGEPCFEKLDANLAKAVLSIGAVKGFEIGSGFAAAKASGKQNNDPFVNHGNGIEKESNHAGGTLGGISDGSRIVLRAAVKPTSSIAAQQHTVNQKGENIEISVKGRHDPVIVPRAVVVVEAMTALTIVDALMEGISARMDFIEKIWGR